MYTKQLTKQYADLLIKLAWSVEIIAVLIGLTISIVMGISAYDAFSQTQGSGFVAGVSAILVTSLPFVLIAVVEICKIPLVFAFMAVKNYFWRGLFLIFVMFLCLITFETMFNGFERNFSNLNRAIDERNNAIADNQAAKVLLEDRRAYIVKFTEEELTLELTQQRDEINTQFATDTQAINRRTSNQVNQISYAFEDELEAKIDQLMLTRDLYYTDWAAETQAVEERFNVLLVGNISGSSQERERLLAELNKLKLEFNNALAGAGFFTRGGIERKYRALIATKEKQLGSITSGYLGGDAITKQSKMQDQLRQQIDFVNSKYQRRVDEINERIDDAKQEIITRTQENETLLNNIYSRDARDKRAFINVREESLTQVQAYEDAQLIKLDEMAQLSFGIDEKIFELNNINRVKLSEINQLINQNQVYRLAMYAYNVAYGNAVTKQMLGTVALLWFGSLSLIAAVCGVMLALAGFYLRRFDGSMNQELKSEMRTDAIDDAEHAAWLSQHQASLNKE